MARVQMVASNHGQRGRRPESSRVPWSGGLSSCIRVCSFHLIMTPHDEDLYADFAGMGEVVVRRHFEIARLALDEFDGFFAEVTGELCLWLAEIRCGQCKDFSVAPTNCCMIRRLNEFVVTLGRPRGPFDA